MTRAPSRRSSAPTPDELPEVLVDRSVGTEAVPRLFHELWPNVVRTVDDVFGLGPVPDTEWMREADERGWVVVCKDGRIRRRINERFLMADNGLRVFCLTNGNLRSAEQVERFRLAMPRMVAAATDVGPWMYGVYADGAIKRLRLYPAEH